MTEKQFLEKLVQIRREIHKNPEIGEAEFKTALFVERHLRALRIPYRRVAKTGVIAILSPSGKNSNAKCIALRADMDALPLHERNKKTYASKNMGVMHACGHDAHIAMLLGAAMLLSKKEKFAGTVKFLFQPNEEGAGGAKSLIAGGAMKNPSVDMTIGLHVNPWLKTGLIGLKPGALMAAVDRFKIEISGGGGHAAYPQEGKDIIPIAAEIVQSLQTIASRKIDPLEPFVLTIGTIQGGTQFNILAGKVTMTGTVRTLSEKVHRQVPRMIRRIAEGISKAHGVKFSMNYERIGSVLFNTKSAVDLSGNVALKIFGGKKIARLESASMGGEDFAEYLKFSPGCFIYIGTGGKSAATRNPWHHPEFDIDEEALPVGARLLSGIAGEFLNGGEDFK